MAQPERRSDRLNDIQRSCVAIAMGTYGKTQRREERRENTHGRNSALRQPNLLARREDTRHRLGREAPGVREACFRCRMAKVFESGSKLHALQTLREVRLRPCCSVLFMSPLLNGRLNALSKLLNRLFMLRRPEPTPGRLQDPVEARVSFAPSIPLFFRPRNSR